MKIQRIGLYKLSELSERAQHKAHEEYLEMDDGPAWATENRQSLEAFCERFPVKAKNWQYGSGMADVTPEMEYSRYEDGVWEMTGLRLRTWLLNNFDEVLYAGKYYSKTISTQPYRYKSRRGTAMIEESCCPFTGYCMDDTLLDPIRKFIKDPWTDTTLEDLLNDALWSWVHACRDECEYEASFEHFAEMCEANGYEWHADGSWGHSPEPEFDVASRSVADIEDLTEIIERLTAEWVWFEVTPVEDEGWMVSVKEQDKAKLDGVTQ